MPVDDQTACDGGRSIGFPKYVADHIELEVTEGAWLGLVAHEGRDIMRVTFTPRAGAEPSETISTDPGLPCLLLSPPGVGPVLSQVETRLFGPRRQVSTAGAASVQADPGEAWAGLLPAGVAPLAATFDELSGDWVLVQSMLSYPSAMKSLIARSRDRGR